MMMEFTNCYESPVSTSKSAAAAVLQQADSAQSLAASSCSCSTGTCSTGTCTDFSSSEGGFDESPAPDAATAAAAAAAASGSLLSLTCDRRAMLGNPLSGVKSNSTLNLTPQQQQLQLHYPALGFAGHRPHHRQQQQQQSGRKRSNAISAKSMSSYLAQYKDAKCVYFDGVLAGDIPVMRGAMAP